VSLVISQLATKSVVIAISYQARLYRIAVIPFLIAHIPYKVIYAQEELQTYQNQASFNPRSARLRNAGGMASRS
jgi:hypothetical protein